MKTIKKLQYMMFATVLAMSHTHVSASATAVAAATPKATTAPKVDTTQAKVLAKKVSNTREAEIAAQKGFMNRNLARASDAMFGQSGRRDAITNQKRNVNDIIDSLDFAPETTIKNVSGNSLDLSSIETKNKTGDTANTTGRTLNDVTSNYLRNSFAKDVKVTKRITQDEADGAYNGFAKKGDKIVETWSKDKKQLLEVKIESSDGSYKVINKDGNIIAARTPDGKMRQNLYSNGTLVQSIVTTPRTLNALESNSMQTRAVTDYSPDGMPTKTVTYKESLLGGKTGDIISIKQYDSKNPLEYSLYKDQAQKILLERRVEKTENGKKMLITEIPSSTSDGGFKVKEIITINPENNTIKSIETFNRSAKSKDKSSETITFNKDGSASKVITNRDGRKKQEILTEDDNLIIKTTVEDINFFNSDNITAITTTAKINAQNKRIGLETGDKIKIESKPNDESSASSLLKIFDSNSATDGQASSELTLDQADVSTGTSASNDAINKTPVEGNNSSS